MIVGNFLTLLEITLFFATDMHHLVIAALNDSYTLFEPGELPTTGDAAALITKTVAGAFRIGIQLSAPFIVFGLVFNIGLGILARLMPQIQVFFVGLPLSILIGLLFLLLLLGAMMSFFLEYAGGVLRLREQASEAGHRRNPRQLRLDEFGREHDPTPMLPAKRRRTGPEAARQKRRRHRRRASLHQRGGPRRRQRQQRSHKDERESEPHARRNILLAQARQQHQHGAGAGELCQGAGQALRGRRGHGGVAVAAAPNAGQRYSRSGDAAVVHPLDRAEAARHRCRRSRGDRTADYLFQYRQWYERQKMSLQEIKEEFRQTEGDPTIKGKLRQLRAKRMRKRIIAAVPKVSVVITNPTHYAIALKYERGMNAPVCWSPEGVDLIAARSARSPKKNTAFPWSENPPLARALHATVEIDRVKFRRNTIAR